MTREEIIDGLKFTVGMFLFDPSTGNDLTKEQLNADDRITVEACEGAIELLKQEPCEDAVSREAAIESLLNNTDLEGYDFAQATDAIENKEKLPSVTPIRPKGKWVGTDELPHEDWECSVCGSMVWGILSPYDFCPNCGCDMREDSDADS